MTKPYLTHNETTVQSISETNHGNGKTLKSLWNNSKKDHKTIHPQKPVQLEQYYQYETNSNLPYVTAVFLAYNENLETQITHKMKTTHK
jgi:ribosomal protein S8